MSALMQDLHYGFRRVDIPPALGAECLPPGELCGVKGYDSVTLGLATLRSE